MSLVDDVNAALQEADRVREAEKQMLGMFELAGYNLTHEPETDPETLLDHEHDLVDPESLVERPKTLIELLKEALGNPPTEPGLWIRIQDIPRYIVENLVVPSRDDLDDFNSTPGAAVSVPGVKPAAQDGLEVELDLPPGYSPNGKRYDLPNEVEVGEYFADSRSRVWEKLGSDSLRLVGDDDTEPYQLFDADWPPLTGLKKHRRA